MNIRKNLRRATPSQNAMNRNKMKKKSSSVYKGVYLVKKGNYKAFFARIAINGKDMHLGAFGDEVNAARAYDEKAIKLFGQFARTNFPISA